MPPAAASSRDAAAIRRANSAAAARPLSALPRPPYAIDFTAVACGKRIANTKRRVRWRFGFANPDALAAGATGTACRGEEHDVTLVWSVTSGKRLLLCDGNEVHYSTSRAAVLDFSWTMRGNHVLKVVAHATAPMSAEPHFRQYDFFVDGRSFFTFPKVYRLGLTPSSTASPDAAPPHGRYTAVAGGRGAAEGGPRAESSRRRKGEGGNGGNGGGAPDIAALEAPHDRDEEDAYLREAIKASLETAARPPAAEGGGADRAPPPMSAGAADLLLDFMGDFDATGNTLALEAAPAPATGGDQWALAAAPQQDNQWAAPPPADPNNGWAAAPPPGATAYAAAPQPDAYAAAPQPNAYAAAPPPDAYAAAPPPNAYAAAPQPHNQAYAAPPNNQGYAASPHQSFAAAPAAGYAPAPAFPAPAPPAAAYGAAPAAYEPPAPAAVDQFAPPAPADPFAPPAGAPAPTPGADGAAPASAAASLTMGSLLGDGLLAGAPTAGAPDPSASATLADAALANLMGSIDSFGLTGAPVKPPGAAAANPFDAGHIHAGRTLGEIQGKNAEKKSVMNAPPGPGALVMARQQGGNWGGQAAPHPQYGLGGSMPPQQPGAPSYAMAGGYQPQPPAMQPPVGMGQSMQGQMPMQGQMQGQPPMGMGQSMQGQMPMQGQMQGQMPMQPQGYGAPQYGQQPPAPQNQWGAPSY